MAGPGYKKMLTKIGNRAGSIVGIGAGVDQLIQARSAKKRALAATPGAVDPTQGAFLAELQQKKNALNTGSEYSSSLDAINDNMAQTQDVLAGNSGGDAGGTVSALLKSQQVANKGEGQLLAQGQESEGMYTGLYGNLLDKVAQRKLELGMVDRQQNLAEYAQKSQNGMSNLTAGVQSMMDIKGGDRQAQQPVFGGSGIGGSSTEVGQSGIGGSTSTTGGSAMGGQKGGVAKNLLNSIGGKRSGVSGGAAIGGSTGGAGGATPGSSGGGKLDFSKFKDIISSFGGK